MTSDSSIRGSRQWTLRAVLLVALILPAIPTLGQDGVSIDRADRGVPRVFALRADALNRSKDRLVRGDTTLRPALENLLYEGARALEVGPFTVMNKSRTPPSGDKHDYMSMGPYWWPDPTEPNGLPYVRRDGERNPESSQGYDRPELGALVEAVETLALAYFFTEDDRYSRRATHLLRVWFLDPETRMNPHLQFGQGIPGLVEGRGIGIIETRSFARIVDAIGLMADAASWTTVDEQGMRMWMQAYLDWLRTSEYGRDERNEHNNHGTWYDVQVVALALFVGDKAQARQVIEESKIVRIDRHILPDGRQPHELARTRSLSYSAMNLEGLCQLAEMGRRVGVDLWHYKSPNGGSIRKALDFLVPYADPGLAWPYRQITRTDSDLLLVHLRRALLVYREDEYAQMISRFPQEIAEAHRSSLIFPDDGDG